MDILNPGVWSTAKLIITIGLDIVWFLCLMHSFCWSQALVLITEVSEVRWSCYVEVHPVAALSLKVCQPKNCNWCNNPETASLSVSSHHSSLFAPCSSWILSCVSCLFVGIFIWYLTVATKGKHKLVNTSILIVIRWQRTGVRAETVTCYGDMDHLASGCPYTDITLLSTYMSVYV